MAEKEAQSNRLSAKIECSHSRDSAIDADLQEWETETLELDIVRFFKMVFYGLHAIGLLLVWSPMLIEDRSFLSEVNANEFIAIDVCFWPLIQRYENFGFRVN